METKITDNRKSRHASTINPETPMNKVTLKLKEGITHAYGQSGQLIKTVEGKLEVFAHEVEGYLKAGFEHIEAEVKAEEPKVEDDGQATA